MMLHSTRGIVLRSVKYGDSSLIITIFTEKFGVQGYIMKGVRSNKKRPSQTSLFQPSTLLDMVVYQHPEKNLQRIREFQFAHIYRSVQESVVKNTIALFSVELLFRMLPSQAIMQHLFDFAFSYFIILDDSSPEKVANFPLYFVLESSRILGYELKGSYGHDTPYLNISEGGFSEDPSNEISSVTEHEAKILSALVKAQNYEEVAAVEMNSSIRIRLLEWYIAFLQQHAQHIGNIKSLQVIRSILH